MTRLDPFPAQELVIADACIVLTGFISCPSLYILDTSVSR